VENVSKQVDSRFRDVALCLYQTQKISTGKLAEWFFTPRHVTEEYLAELSREKESAISDDPNHEGETAATG
jgi:hypothetical protein